MTRIEGFDLAATLRRLDDLVPERMQETACTDLEWVLGDFMLSWGQRLLLDPATWPPPSERAWPRSMGERFLPFSIVADFPHVTDRQWLALAAAGTSHGLAVLMLDEIVDEEGTVAAVKLVLPHVLAHAYGNYRNLFPADSIFWKQLEECSRRTTCAMEQEFVWQKGQVPSYSPDEFKRLAADKFAVSCAIPIALSLLNGTPEYIPVLLKCFDAIAIADAAQDDIRDWRRDYVARNFTFPLARVLLAPPFQEQVQTGHLPPVRLVEAALLCDDVFESLYDLACVELETARQAALTMHCKAVARLVEKTLAMLRNDHAHLLARKCMILLVHAQARKDGDLYHATQ